jgi:mannose-6-phosphate isomerase-like protein (cupin superfamily)
MDEDQRRLSLRVRERLDALPGALAVDAGGAQR